MGGKHETLHERFHNHVLMIPFHTCWEWDGCISPTGYARIATPDGYTDKAHRIAYELYKGPIPEGLTIDHLCRNRSCVNPDHLEAVPQGVNTLRGNTITATHAAKTHCPQGHEYTPTNTWVNRSGSRQCRTCRRQKARRQTH